MTAQNWMIGDWYQWYAECRYYPYQVKPEDFTNDYIANFEPIPLTAEILMANGFVIEPDGLTWYDGIHNPSQVYVNIALRKTGEVRRVNILNHRKSFCVDGCETYYVHELQRALRCCGLTDLADNFKLEKRL